MTRPPRLRYKRANYGDLQTPAYRPQQSHQDQGHFPTDKAALKLLHLAVRNITTERGGPAGTGTWRWKECLNALAIYFPDRITIT